MLSKNWFEKAKQIQHHPIANNNYEYDPLTDKYETLYSILTKL